MTHDIGERPASKPIPLRSRTCAYCGVRFGAAARRTTEHVIGRKFVPTGPLNGQWNILVYACASCNVDKSNLENDISAISMQPDVFGRFPCDDPRLAAEARRKAQGSFSRRTSKMVKDSAEAFTLTVPFGPATAMFNMVSGPQVDRERLERLAWYHVRAFFYLVTYSEDTRTGSPLPGVFAPLADAARRDWGNARMCGFMSATRSWHHRMFGIGADGFFKVWIRRHPNGAPVWAWAVEWNQNLRVVGFFGDENDVVAAADALPKLEVRVIQQPPNIVYRYREEVALPADEDYLFVLVPAAEDVAAACG